MSRFLHRFYYHFSVKNLFFLYIRYQSIGYCKMEPILEKLVYYTSCLRCVVIWIWVFALLEIAGGLICNTRMVQSAAKVSIPNGGILSSFEQSHSYLQKVGRRMRSPTFTIYISRLGQIEEQYVPVHHGGMISIDHESIYMRTQSIHFDKNVDSPYSPIRLTK